jgi:hypothetical protein
MTPASPLTRVRRAPAHRASLAHRIAPRGREPWVLLVDSRLALVPHEVLSLAEDPLHSSRSCRSAAPVAPANHSSESWAIDPRNGRFGRPESLLAGAATASVSSGPSTWARVDASCSIQTWPAGKPNGEHRSADRAIAPAREVRSGSKSSAPRESPLRRTPRRSAGAGMESLCQRL